MLVSGVRLGAGAGLEADGAELCRSVEAHLAGLHWRCCRGVVPVGLYAPLHLRCGYMCAGHVLQPQQPTIRQVPRAAPADGWEYPPRSSLRLPLWFPWPTGGGEGGRTLAAAVCMPHVNLDTDHDPYHFFSGFVGGGGLEQPQFGGHLQLPPPTPHGFCPLRGPSCPADPPCETVWPADTTPNIFSKG